MYKTKLAEVPFDRSLSPQVEILYIGRSRKYSAFKKLTYALSKMYGEDLVVEGQA
jgi:hypothetical protein